MSRKKKKKSGQRFTGIPNHKRFKSTLMTPLKQLNVQPIEWDRDLLPEHLWIESLADTYAENVWPVIYNKFLDELDKYFPEGKTIILGFVTDFGLIPKEKRDEFIKNNEPLIHDAFYKPFGRLVAFYPDAPCYWLLKKEDLEKDGPLDPDVELPRLTKLVLNLMPGKDLHAGHIRAVPLNRMLKHNKLFIKKGMFVVDLLPKYPVGCNEEEKYRVQQFARITMNVQFQQAEHYKQMKWPKYFWRHNYDITPCMPRLTGFKGADAIKEEGAKQLYEFLTENASIAIEYLNDISIKHKYDFYKPERDEILLGLFSRVTRLYVLFCTTPYLWARDIAGIILRCLAETAIIFGYLAKVGGEEEFEAFKSYGEGKEKLLMLHLQDTYTGKKSLEGKGPEEIGEDLGGGFMPELINIELSDWTKKSGRELAIEAGLEEIYRLVFDPTSQDIHGTWISLRNSNLGRCVQPLHRFHRMPHYFEPPLFVDTIVAGQKIYLLCTDIGVDNLHFPKLSVGLKEPTSIVEEKKNGEAGYRKKDD